MFIFNSKTTYSLFTEAYAMLNVLYLASRFMDGFWSSPKDSARIFYIFQVSNSMVKCFKVPGNKRHWRMCHFQECFAEKPTMVSWKQTYFAHAIPSGNSGTASGHFWPVYWKLLRMTTPFTLLGVGSLYITHPMPSLFYVPWALRAS